MSELTLTLLRLGLLALLWIFIFVIVGVLRTDLYGTKVSRRSQRRAARRQSDERVASTAGAARAGAVADPGVAMSTSTKRGRSRGRRRASRVPSTLVVVEGPLAGTRLPLRGSGVLIGRNPECTLVLDDDYASGRHCRIHPDPSGEGWVVEDLGSTNGTYVGRDNRDKLTSPRPVTVGTTLRIGTTVLELQG